MKIQCSHAEQGSGRQVCRHLLDGLANGWTVEQFSHYRRFTGQSLDYVFTCAGCREQPSAQFPWVCGECFVDIAHGARLGSLGQPQVAERSGGLQLLQVDQWPAEPRLLQVVPFGDGWAALTNRQQLLTLDAGRRRAFELAKWGFRAGEELTLAAAEPYVAIASRAAGRCLVVEVSSGQLINTLRHQASPGGCFPFSFTPQRQLIHGTQSNRLELSNPGGSALKTLRVPKDYHQSGISLAPGGHWLALNGWIWEGMGEVRVLNLDDDGPSRPLCQRDGYWDGPLVWLGDARLAVAGLGQIDVMMLPGVRVFDLESKQELPAILGPDGPFAYDEYLFCQSPGQGFSAWDTQTGQRLFQDRQFFPLAYHPTQRVFLSQSEQGLILSRLQ